MNDRSPCDRRDQHSLKYGLLQQRRLSGRHMRKYVLRASAHQADGFHTYERGGNNTRSPYGEKADWPLKETQSDA